MEETHTDDAVRFGLEFVNGHTQAETRSITSGLQTGNSSKQSNCQLTDVCPDACRNAAALNGRCVTIPINNAP